MKARKIFGIFLVLCLLLTVAVPVFAEVVSPTADFYVYDGADVLSDETESDIITHSRELESKTGAQIVVVTIPSLEGSSLEEYAVELFRQWGIGDKEKNNGLLLLCAVEDRQFRVEVGYGLEGDLPDGKTGRMQDKYIIPFLKNDKFDAGIQNGYHAFLEEVSGVYGVSVSGKTPVVYGDDEEELGPEFLICLVIGWLISFLGAVFLLKKKQKKYKTAFWALEAVQVLVFWLVLQSFFNAFWIAGTGLAFGLGLMPGRRRFRGGGHWGGGFGGGFGGGGFSGGGFGGGGFSGGGFSGGGGRSGGGGSSRGF